MSGVQLAKQDSRMGEEEAISEKTSMDSDDSDDDEPKKPASFREKLAVFLQTNKVQYTIIFLVVFDSLIVIFELLIDMEIITIPESHHGHHGNDTHHNLLANNSHHVVDHYDTYSTSTAAAGLPPTPHHQRLMQNISLLHHNNNNNNNGYSSGAHLGAVHSNGATSLPVSAVVDANNNATDGGGVEGPKGEEEHTPNRHTVEHVLHMASLIILSIFLVEVMFKILAEGTHLLKHKAEVFDAIVVVVSFTMDITFTFVSVSQATQDYAGLLVLLRLWRVTRIINGVILSVKMDADKKLKAQKKLREKAERQVVRLSDKVEKLTRENAQLKSQLSVLDTGGSEPYSGQDFMSDRMSRRSGASGSVVTFQCGDQGATTTASIPPAALLEGGESASTPDGDLAPVTFRTGSPSSKGSSGNNGNNVKTNNNRYSGFSAASSNMSQQGSNSYQGSCCREPPPRTSSSSSSLARHAGSPRGSNGDRPSLSKQASYGSSTRYSPSNATSPGDSQRNSLCRETSAGSFSSIPLQQGSSDGGKPSPGKTSPSNSSYSSFNNRKSASGGSLRSPSGGALAPESQQLLSYDEAVSISTGREEEEQGLELRPLPKSASADSPLKKSTNNQFVPGVS